MGGGETVNSILQRYGPTAAAMLALAGLISGLVVSASAPAVDRGALPRVVRPVPETLVVDARPGEPVWFTWSGTFNPRGAEPVFVTGIELLRVHPELKVERVRAVDSRAGAVSPPPQFFAGPIDTTKIPLAALKPVTAAFFVPGRDEQAWYFIAGVSAPKSGTYRIGGWRLRYRSAGDEGTTTYEQMVEIHVR